MSPLQRWTVIAVLVLGIPLAGVRLISWAIEPTAPALASIPRPSVRASSAPSSDPTVAAAIIEMAHAVSTALAPTPLPATPTPTYAALPTPLPMICGRDSQVGHLCQWAQPTPTATPGPPTCLTPSPGDVCVYHGDWRTQGRGDER